ncbi:MULTISPECIES: gluconokinase [unclassified Cupriavidus]|uniref:gluconokinase n=1 Tax=unclassified Cupriavidus TaxID=2640874 RepID=UPI001BFFDDC4|nr:MULTISPECIES: gluconokinase [unclassified Cupriavidus]MCA3185221.1 gluconokinase [Cupriavidus sp.]MCA3191267.1 gluconokinase [Cupriavidus sp.]MCA3196703.1 gluconokinase [Cupriavidus sp.]MCA3203282.1 gluconokinase [Cupriavidus sp.]MCA3210006.1 gluconokinase [Cupriavidus sp.]
MIYILMGVSGSGKTTVGQLLAAQLHCGFHDADTFHSEANKAKMHAGTPLTDEDRWPWLAAMRAAIDTARAEGRTHVFTCSALRQIYRDRLTPPDGGVTFVFMKGDAATIGGRLSARSDHFFNPALLQSQFDTLEEPRDALVLDIRRPPEALVQDILAKCPPESASCTGQAKTAH